MKKNSRRKFIRKVGKSTVALAGAHTLLNLTENQALAHSLRPVKRFTANDKIIQICAPTINHAILQQFMLKDETGLEPPSTKSVEEVPKAG